jgi:hypothetical protein
MANLLSVPYPEIELDGAFVADTPSTFTATAGDHVITMAKKAYKSWAQDQSVKREDRDQRRTAS